MTRIRNLLKCLFIVIMIWLADGNMQCFLLQNMLPCLSQQFAWPTLNDISWHATSAETSCIIYLIHHAWVCLVVPWLSFALKEKPNQNSKDRYFFPSKNWFWMTNIHQASDFGHYHSFVNVHLNGTFRAFSWSFS